MKKKREREIVINLPTEGLINKTKELAQLFLGRLLISKDMKKLFYISLFLRIGLAIGFVYAAISSLLNPTNWIGFVPDFVEILISKELFLTLYSVFEIVLGLFLILNYKTFYVSIVSTATLFFITIGNLSAFDIVFRDVAILFMSVALNVLSWEK
jgi:uncharacterized membrane protein YphA (DoxX/SURF4 family)